MEERRRRQYLATTSSDGTPARDDGVVEPEHNHGSNDGDQQAVEVEPGDAGLAKLVEQKAAHDGADDAEQDVDDETLAGVRDPGRCC